MSKILFSLLIVSSALFSGCGSKPIANQPLPNLYGEIPSIAVSLESPNSVAKVYKIVFMSPDDRRDDTVVYPFTFEIPVNWSVTHRGDVGLVAWTPEDHYATWDRIRYSIAENFVSYSGTSTADVGRTQIDFLITEPGMIPSFIDNRKKNRLEDTSGQFIDSWETKQIGGQDVTVRTFLENSADSADQNYPNSGGAMYFFPEKNMIIHKRVSGREFKAFEAGFARFLDTLRFIE